MRKAFFTHFFLWCLVLGFAFTTVAQDHSVGKVPVGTEKHEVNYWYSNDPIDVETAYAHPGISAQFVTFPIPDGTPFTTISGMTDPGFLSSACFGPDGTLYFTDTSTFELYTVNKATGAMTLVGSTGVGLNGITYDWSTGIFWGVDATSLYTVNVSTGATTLVGPFGLGGGELMIDIAAACDGSLFAYDLVSNGFYSINSGTGAATLIGDIGFDANYGQGLSYDYVSGTLYMSAFNNTTVTGQLRQVNVATGGTTLLFDWGFEQVAPFAIDNGCNGTLTIEEAIEDLDGDLIPDRLGQIVTVEGVVFTPNYQTSSTSYFIHDGTAGVDIFLYGTVLSFNAGDLLMVTGEVDQYNGLTEIAVASETDITLMSTGNPTPNPMVLTIGQYNADPEPYEGDLIAFQYVSLVGGTWPAPGSYATVQISDGVDTVDMFIDSDTDIDDNPEPTWPRDIIGVGSQYCSGGCVDHGYQVMPRYYASDFLPPGTIPVELTGFSANVSDGIVTLNWSTATETNNLGFEVQRSFDGNFQTIAFVQGHGTTTETHDYYYVDNTVETGNYTYRLKQVDYNGNLEYSEAIQVEVVAPVAYSLEQNYPNPFNPSTKIVFNLAADSKVTLTIFNVLGEKVMELANSNFTAGNHTLDFNASALNSGVYFYRIDAVGVDGTNFSSVRKMALTK